MRRRTTHTHEFVSIACPLGVFAKSLPSSLPSVWLLQPSQDVLNLLREGDSIPNRNTDDLLRGVVTKSFAEMKGVAPSMFLDVVAVMHGADTRWCGEALALDIWRSWYGAGVNVAWQELQRRSLVTVSEAVFHVHDVIKALGRGIIKEDRDVYYGSRVWVQHDGQLVQFVGQVCVRGRNRVCKDVERRLCCSVARQEGVWLRTGLCKVPVGAGSIATARCWCGKVTEPLPGRCLRLWVSKAYYAACRTFSHRVASTVWQKHLLATCRAPCCCIASSPPQHRGQHHSWPHA